MSLKLYAQDRLAGFVDIHEWLSFLEWAGRKRFVSVSLIDLNYKLNKHLIECLAIKMF